jgi:YD repeat-containing protein
MHAFFEALWIYGIFLNTHIGIAPDSKVLSRVTAIDILGEDTTRTEWRYRDSGREIVTHTGNRPIVDNWIYGFTLDSLSQVREFRMRHQVGENDFSTERRFEFAYTRGHLLENLRIYSFDTLESEFVYHRDAPGRIDAIDIHYASTLRAQRDIRLTLAYDDAGNLIRVLDGSARTEFVYGPGGRVTGKTRIDLASGNVIVEQRFAYDADGKMIRGETYEDGDLMSSVTYEYSPLPEVLPILRPARRAPRDPMAVGRIGARPAFDLLGRRSPLLAPAWIGRR